MALYLRIPLHLRFPYFSKGFQDRDLWKVNTTMTMPVCRGGVALRLLQCILANVQFTTLSFEPAPSGRIWVAVHRIRAVVAVLVTAGISQEIWTLDLETWAPS